MQLFRLAYFGRVRADLPKQEGFTKAVHVSSTAHRLSLDVCAQMTASGGCPSYLLLDSAAFRPPRCSVSRHIPVDLGIDMDWSLGVAAPDTLAYICQQDQMTLEALLRK